MLFTTDLKYQLRTLVAIALAVAVGIVGAGAATAAFDDVGPEGRFAESITRVQEAGIATGFPDGSFRPEQGLNRQQAAAWIDRSAGRVGFDLNARGQVLTAESPEATISSVEMSSAAAADGTGWVTVQGAVGGVANAAGASCPCVAHAFVRDDHGNLAGRTVLTVQADPTGQAITTAPVFAVVPIQGGETTTYTLTVRLVSLDQQITVGGVIYAQYLPMADGDPAAIPESAASDPVESPLP